LERLYRLSAEITKAEIPEPVDAFVLNLKEGKYEIRVRDDKGNIIRGSEKNLIVFSGKQAVGYQIIRKDNWPARCDNPLETIYLAEKDILYFTPVREIGYDDFYYSKLLNPQTIKGVKGAWSWVYLEPTKNLTLSFSKSKRVLEKIEPFKYYVDLIPGHALGFNILKSTGEVVSGSERDIRMVREENTGIIYLPALISLPFGLFIFIVRRRKYKG